MGWFGKRTGIIDWILGAFLGATALAVYLATLSIGASNGQSANLVVQAMGLFPQMSPANPLWRWIAAGLATHMGVGALNGFSAICGALAVWLLYAIMSGTVRALIEENEHNVTRVAVASRLAGVVSALVLGFCIPFWIVSNRAHMATFDLLMLLGVGWLLLQFARTGRESYGLLFALAYGLGTVEFATFIVMAPLAGLYLLFLYHKYEKMRFGTMSLLVLAALIGLSLYFLAAWLYWGSAGYKIREYPGGYFNVVWYTWREQYYLITSSMPREGWLTILILTVLPWLTCLTVAARALNEEKDWAFYLLHLTLTAIAVAVVAGMPYAPWQLLKFRQLLVTPYLLTAMVMGYLAAYWFLLPFIWQTEDEDGRLRTWPRVVGGLLALGFLVLGLVVPFRNLDEADARPARQVNQLARWIVQSLPEGCSWLVSDGQMDNHVLLAAHELHRPVQVINIMAGDSSVYQLYVAGLFESPRLKNMARLGMVPMVQEWMRTDPEITRKLAFLTMPDFWQGSGFIAVPWKLVFLGARSKDDVPADLMAPHDAFWKAVSADMTEWAAGRAPLRGRIGFEDYACRLLGMVANNLGVLCEDLGRPGDAFRAYSKARELDPGNISALMNQWVMVDAGLKTESAEAIKADMDALMKDPKTAGLKIWSLSRSFGYVRTPHGFAQVGLNWAVSGQAGMGISGLQRALELLPEDQKGDIKQTLANIYFGQEENDKSEALLAELLAADPNNKDALMGMARIAARKNDLKSAREWLLKAEKAGVNRLAISSEQASLLMRAGEPAKARVVLEEVVELEPNALMAWALLGEVMVSLKDEAGLRKCIQKIDLLKGNRGLMVHLRAQLAIMQNDVDTARDMFLQALSMTRGNVYVLENLLALDMMQDRKDDGAAHARAILKIDPDNALANLAMGSLQIMAEQYELAEDSLQRSVAKRRSPEALNELAVLLARRGAYTNAEPLVLEALKGRDKFPEAWDTYAVILMRTGRPAEAREAFQKALGIGPVAPEVYLNFGELEISQKKKDKALELLEKAAEGQKRMPLAMMKRMEKLRREALDIK